MKKRNLFATLLLVLTMVITACGGSTNPFEGEWRGTCDLTDYITEEVLSGSPELEEYLEFEDLSFVIEFTFEEDEMKMSVDEDSVEDFIANIEDGMRKMLDAYVTDMLENQYAGMFTAEELAAASGYESYNAFLDAAIAEADMSAIVEPLTEELNLEGTYEYDEEDGILTVTYEDDSEEEMKFEFDDDKLTITVSDGTDDFDIECEKE